MVVYDEADELFIQKENKPAYVELQRQLKEINRSPQHCMYSATFTDEVMKLAS
jgi:superfamily II DNA/RNA helicase